MTQIDGVTVAIDADTSAFRREIAAADRLARGFGASIGGALSSAIVYGRNFNDVLSRLGLRLSSLAINAALKPLEQGLSGLFQGLFSVPGAAASLAARGASTVVPFARGGVISAPGFFPLGSNIGLAGERGAEAIMPLTRGADGRLGVAAQRQPSSPVITVNVSTPDAASFRRSEAYLSGMIARAVSRGGRSL
jgi:phage-related minor tail protein